MSKKNSTLSNRIKKMMQADDDVGKISQQTPIVIGEVLRRGIYCIFLLRVHICKELDCLRSLPMLKINFQPSRIVQRTQWRSFWTSSQKEQVLWPQTEETRP